MVKTPKFSAYGLLRVFCMHTQYVMEFKVQYKVQNRVFQIIGISDLPSVNRFYSKRFCNPHPMASPADQIHNMGMAVNLFIKKKYDSTYMY